MRRGLCGGEEKEGRKKKREEKGERKKYMREETQKYRGQNDERTCCSVLIRDDEGPRVLL